MVIARSRTAFAGVGAWFHKSEKPIGGEVVSELENLRVIAPELLTHAAGQTSSLLLQLVGHPRPLAQLHNYWLVATGSRRKAKNPASATPIVSNVVATGRPMNGADGSLCGTLRVGLAVANAKADRAAEGLIGVLRVRRPSTPLSSTKTSLIPASRHRAAQSRYRHSTESGTA